MKESANPFLRDFQRKRPRMNGLAGSLPFIRSNLCTRHILNKITPRGHEDWPDKRCLRTAWDPATRPVDVRWRFWKEPRSVVWRPVAPSSPFQPNLAVDRLPQPPLTSEVT